MTRPSKLFRRTATLGAALSASMASAQAPAWVGEGRQSFSAALHIHGSMSEGTGSVHAGAQGAAFVGADVIWWSDHDWRIQMYTYVTRCSLDMNEEPAFAGESWSPRSAREQNALVITREAQSEAVLNYWFDFRSHTYITGGQREGDGYLLVGARSNEGMSRDYELEIRAERRRLVRPLSADVTLRISIRPDITDVGSTPIVRALLSRHGEYDGIQAGTYQVIYTLDNDATEPTFNPNTRKLVVPLPFIEGEWNDYVLPLSDDATANLTHMDARDLSLFELYMGVSSTDGRDAMAGFDDLRISHLRTGEELLEIQRSIFADAEALVPEVEHHQGLEFSYYEHLNVFVEDVELYDYDQMIADSGLLKEGELLPLPEMLAYSAEFIAEETRARGGVVSYNHPFGVANTITNTDPEEVLAKLTAARVYDADILEVGYNLRGRPLEDLLWLWDNLAINGIVMTGTGVSDSHGANPDQWDAILLNNMFSWIYADDTSKGALIEGLRRGAVYFGEMRIWGGTVDLRTERDERMGEVVITDRATTSIEYYADSLITGDELRLVVNNQLFATVPVTGSEAAGQVLVPLEESGITVVRVELYRNTIPMGFSNPVYFARNVPRFGIDPVRAVIDLEGLRTTRVEGFDLRSVNGSNDNGLSTVGVIGTASNGTIEFDLTAFGEPRTIQFGQTLTGDIRQEGSRLIVENMTGAGSLFVSSETSVDPCPADCDLDLSVDFADLICILFEFGQTDSLGDADGSGVVDFADLLAAIFSFGPCN